MRRITKLALVSSVLAALAIATASASAAPPEFTPPFPKAFTATSGLTTLETVSLMKIECAADTAAGAITAPESGTISLKFTGCELVLPTGKIPCTSAGQPPETILTGPLPAQLGYITHTPLKTYVGLQVGVGEALFAEFVCANRVIVRGAIIGKISPINKVVKPLPAHFTLAFKQAKGKQKPRNFEGGPLNFFATSFGGPFEESGLTSKELVGFSEPVQIIA